MGTLLQDLKYGIRMLARNPGFTAVAVITLALGIGPNAAIFTVVNSLLLRPLPYRDPERLVIIWETSPGVPIRPVSYPDFLDWRAQNRAFEQMTAFHWTSFSLTGFGPPEHIAGAEVNGNFLSTLGVTPRLGRDFAATDDTADAQPVALISDRLWERRFGSDPGALGKTLALDGRDFTVIGALPPRFKMYLVDCDVYLPIGLAANKLNNRGSASDMAVIARLKDGMTLAKAQSEMATIAGRLAHQYPNSNAETEAKIESLREQFVGELRPAVLVLLGAVGFVLLIACANLANLLLARATAREKEMAIRAALGARRARVMRQLLTESVLLAAVGGGFGLLLGIWGASALVALIPVDFQTMLDLSINRPVLWFTLTVSLLTGTVSGLAPALQASRNDVNDILKEGGRTGAPAAGRHRFRDALVISEVALALILLTSAGLMIRSVRRLLGVEPGFDPENVLVADVSLRGPKYVDDAHVRAFWQQVLERVRALPGVKFASVGTDLPLTFNHGITSVAIQGQPAPRPGRGPIADYHVISPDYLRAMGIPLLKGRLLKNSDQETAPNVALVGQAMARQHWPNQDPVGKQFRKGSKGPWLTVVGVVGDTQQYGLDSPVKPEFYLPYAQSVNRSMSLVVRTASSPLSLSRGVENQIREVDPDQPVSQARSMDQIASESIATQRVTMILLGIFAALAAVLAATGLYGVMAYSAARRTHEIGIRIALGAARRDVLRLVVGQGMTLALVGVGIGLVAALGLTRLLASLLYGVSPGDPLTFASVSILLTLVALAACYIPARRATKVDPMEALRYE